MYKRLVFIDYDNGQNLPDNYVDKTTKLILFVKPNLQDKSVEFVKNHIKKVFSIEIVNVNHNTNNAADHFLTFYLGNNLENIRSKEVIICSEDTDFDPIFQELKESGINIDKKSIKSKNQKNKISKEKLAEKTSIVQNDRFDKLLKHLESIKGAMPKKISTLKIHLTGKKTKLNLSNKEVEQLVKECISRKVITVDEKTQKFQYHGIQ